MKAYELGIKGTAFDRAATFNFDVFQSDYSDLQESLSFVSPVPPFITIQVVGNVAAARSKGIEFNGAYRVSDWLSFNTDVSFVKSRYRSYPAAPCTSLQIVMRGTACSQDLSGRPRFLAPDFSGVVGAVLTVPVGDGYTFGANPQLYHSSSYYLNGSLEPQLLQRAYQKVDLRLDFGPADRHWEIALLGKNLTNRISTTVGFTTSGSAGSVQVLPERARSFALSLTIRN